MLHRAFGRSGLARFLCLDCGLIGTPRAKWASFDISLHGVNLKTRKGLQVFLFVCFVLAIIWFSLTIIYCSPVAWQVARTYILCPMNLEIGVYFIGIDWTCSQINCQISNTLSTHIYVWNIIFGFLQWLEDYLLGIRFEHEPSAWSGRYHILLKPWVGLWLILGLLQF